QNESQDLSGALVLKPIKAGEVISPSALLARTDPEFVAAVLAPGMRAFTIEVDMVTGGAGLLRPGNRVDVILAAQTDPQKSRAFASQKNFDVARTLLHNLRVIAVDHTIEPKGFGADPQSSDPRMVRSSTPANINRKGTVTLEVTPKDVELLTVARSNGQLSLSLRNSQSGEAVQTGLPEKELTKLAEIIPSRSDKTPPAAVKVKTFYGSSTEPPQQ
ncbi:MAG: Flp pilus assembly protein CpaB, partial [Sutterella sp. 54_7]